VVQDIAVPKRGPERPGVPQVPVYRFHVQSADISKRRSRARQNLDPPALAQKFPRNGGSQKSGGSGHEGFHGNVEKLSIFAQSRRAGRRGNPARQPSAIKQFIRAFDKMTGPGISATSGQYPRLARWDTSIPSAGEESWFPRFNERVAGE
jgi:hypothetical protein